ncbi:AraC family transcriptional regulator [Halioxenophilus aromaticivorans]|uniref:AraC family transcriptional regulator n=1 Tax=Halioxenophilus aromaticivorans TaxID=1306992 RepID=A0AAV3TX12_9ALTE
MQSAIVEHIVNNQYSSFHAAHRQCADFASEHAWHCHQQLELTWIIRSQGVRYVGDHVDYYGPGDLVLCGANLPHCWRNQLGDNTHNPEWITIQFAQPMLQPMLATLPETEPLVRLLDNAQQGLVFPTALCQQLAPVLTATAQTSGLQRFIHLLQLLDTLAQNGGQQLASLGYFKANHLDGTHLQRLAIIHDYISSHLATSITQADIAQQLGMSASAFSKFFRAATGQTFMSLVKLLRINEASKLLLTTDQRITDIALNCGYQHTSHFDQHFKELKGCSPIEFRQGKHTAENLR